MVIIMFKNVKSGPNRALRRMNRPLCSKNDGKTLGGEGYYLRADSRLKPGIIRRFITVTGIIGVTQN